MTHETPLQSALFQLWLARLRYTTIFILSHIENAYNQVKGASRDN